MRALGAGIPLGVVAELTENPSRQDLPQARLTQVDLGVSGSPKTGCHLLLERGDLAVEGGDDRA